MQNSQTYDQLNVRDESAQVSGWSYTINGGSIGGHKQYKTYGLGEQNDSCKSLRLN